MRIGILGLLIAFALHGPANAAEAESGTKGPTMQGMMKWKRDYLSKYDTVFFQDEDSKPISEDVFFRLVVTEKRSFIVHTGSEDSKRLTIRLLRDAASSQELDSRWRLRVMDLNNQLKVDATIRLTNESAQSCMGGSWKRAVVEAKTAQAIDFFPLQPLAYKLERNVLTLGRTQICDGYLFLTGKMESPTIRGSFDAVGWGSKKLGTFSLQKIQ